MKILVIDYQENMLFNRMLDLIGEDSGCELFHAANPREAVDFLKQNPVDAVITDFILPRGSALELLKEVCSVNPGIMAIITYSSMDFRPEITMNEDQRGYDHHENSLSGELRALIKKLNRKITQDSGNIIMLQIKKNKEIIFTDEMIFQQNLSV